MKNNSGYSTFLKYFQTLSILKMKNINISIGYRNPVRIAIPYVKKFLMNQRTVDQLDKVLALADSSHEGEAVGAVRKARQMLSRDGLSFGDLARAASTKARFSLPRSLFSGQLVHLEAQIVQLQQLVRDMRGDNQSLQTQIEFWRRRAFEMEQQLNLTQSESQRWKQLARETAEKLWDMSQYAKVPEAAETKADDLPISEPLKAAQQG
jgi:hypothetical protein